MIGSILLPGSLSQRFRWRIEQRADGTHGTDASLPFLATERHFLSIRDLLTIGTIAPLPRPSLLSTLTADHVIALLKEYTRQTGATVDILLVGALALQAYGYQDRLTRDVDAEVIGSVEALAGFFSRHQLPADLTENFSGWSIVAMPPGYRERATDLVHQAQLRVKLLAPVDFIISKLRRGTDLDLDDASFVATRFGITTGHIRHAAEAAVTASPQDTALFLFRKTVDLFCQSLPPVKP